MIPILRINFLWHLKVLLMLVFLIAATNASADQFDKASDFYNKGSYKKAGGIWQKLGESSKDDGRSHYQLAELYREGLGYEKDHSQAAFWYRSAAEKGYIPAMYELGVLHYRDGDESVRNVLSAKLWWEKAANLGHVFSQREMAQYYISKDKDLVLALIYARAAAVANDQAAFILLKDIDKQIAALSIAGPDDLRVIPQDHYTLALASFVDFNSAWSFVVKNSVVGAHLHQSVFGEYDVTLGNYKNLNDSYAAITELSADLRALSPRPKSLKVIHHVLLPPVNNLDTQWVKERDPNKYTVEIYRANSDIDANDLVNEANLSNSSVYRSVFADSVVVAGVFESSEDANQVINALPNDLQALRPIARRFADVQGEVLELKNIQSAVVRSDPVKSEVIKPEVVKSEALESQVVKSDVVLGSQPEPDSASSNEKGITNESSSSDTERSAANINNTELSNEVDPIDRSADHSGNSQTLFSAGDQWLFGAARGAYTFQVATLRSDKGLQAAISKFRKKYNDLDVHIFDQQDPEYYYIYLGLFDDWAAVNNAQSELNIQGAVIRGIGDTRERRCLSWSKRKELEPRYQEYCL